MSKDEKANDRAEAKAKEEAAIAEAAEAKAKAVKLAKDEAIVDGRRSILTRAGIKSKGDVVKADDLAGGKDAFDRLVKAGVLKK